MQRRNSRKTMSVGLSALAFAIGLASVPAFAQSAHYPSARKLDDNGSVSEPGPAGGNAAISRPSRRRRRLVNYQAPQTQPPPHQYYPSARKADDNGSVDEPGPGR